MAPRPPEKKSVRPAFLVTASLGVLTLGLVAVIGWMLYRGQKFTSGERLPATGENDCFAEVASIPEGAKVSINGLAIGLTPTSIEASCDQPVDIDIEREGFEPVSHTIRVKSKSSKMNVTLIPKPLAVPKGGDK